MGLTWDLQRTYIGLAFEGKILERKDAEAQRLFLNTEICRRPTDHREVNHERNEEAPFGDDFFESKLSKEQ